MGTRESCDRAILISFFIVGASGAVCGCSRSSSSEDSRSAKVIQNNNWNAAPSEQVHFIVPDKYRGIFKLSVVESAPSPPRERGKCVFTIPENGILRIPEMGILGRWHATSVEFKNGLSVRVGDGPPIEPFDASIAFHEVGSNSDNEIIFLIGTEAELHRILKDNDYALGGIANK